MMQEDGHPDFATLPCTECPSALPEEGYQLVSVFHRSASYETYKKNGVEKKHVSIDWPLVSLLTEEEEDRARIIRDIADLRHELNSQ